MPCTTAECVEKNAFDTNVSQLPYLGDVAAMILAHVLRDIGMSVLRAVRLEHIGIVEGVSSIEVVVPPPLVETMLATARSRRFRFCASKSSPDRRREGGHRVLPRPGCRCRPGRAGGVRGRAVGAEIPGDRPGAALSLLKMLRILVQHAMTLDDKTPLQAAARSFGRHQAAQDQGNPRLDRFGACRF